MSVRILIGDCRVRMQELPDASVDSVVCDPPYHLTSIVKRFGAENAAPAKSNGATGVYARASKGFMGQTWDGGDVAFDPETWAEVLRVLKPGGHLIAFSGTRTYHRMVCAIEDAGFEIRDMICWHYGSGFPKSHNVAKAITALEKHGGSNPQALRKARQGEDYAPTGQADYRKGRAFSAEIESDDRETELTENAKNWEGYGTALKPSTEPICLARKPLIGSVASNVLTHGTGALNIDGCRIEGEGNKTFERDAGDRSREQYRTGTTVGAAKPTDLGRWPANLCHDGSEEVLAGFPEVKSGSLTPEQQERGGWAGTKNCYGTAARGGSGTYEATEGSAARFFYCAKATTEERGEGNNHPTVKPVSLMRWLVRLVTPKGGTVLDPFMGSGSTGIAADAEQFDFIGCELSGDYAEIARRRIADQAGLFADISVEHTGPSTRAA